MINKKNNKNKEDVVTISVYLNHVDGSWRASKRINHEPVSKENDERDKSLAIEICKAFAVTEGGLFHGPKYIFLPSGIYRNNGSGYCFITSERDVGYTKLTEKESDLLLKYDCKTVWERICRWICRRWHNLKLTLRPRVKFGAEVNDAPAFQVHEEKVVFPNETR